MDCRQRINASDGTEFYRDILEFSPRSVPGFTYLSSIAGVTTIVLIFILSKRKRIRKI